MPAESIANPFLRADAAVRSLNRARIAALDGTPMADGVLGMSGYELLSAASLRRLIMSSAASLRLDPAAPDLVRGLDACFGDPATSPYAVEIAHLYGRRLGSLLLMLKRGEPANRAVRPEWSDAHWAFWRAVRRVYVGGGVMSGQLGRYAVDAAQALLADAGVADLALERAAFAAYLPLIGLARCAPPGVTRSIVFDFGQTSVKRGCARYRLGQLRALDVWPSAPAVCADLDSPPGAGAIAQRRWQRIVEIIAASWAAIPPRERPRTAIGICLACYLFDGHPSPQDQGCYGVLGRLAEHLATFVAGDLARRLGQAVEVTLMHDGAAAAAAYAGHERAVVITLGTAIGNGFPPLGSAVRPIAGDFALVPAAGPPIGTNGG